MIRKWSREEYPLAMQRVDRERNFIFFSNLLVRPERSFCVGEVVGEQVQAIACYLTGMPFHAFSIHLEETACPKGCKYPVRELFQALLTEVPLPSDSPQTGYLSLAAEDAERIDLEGILSSETMLLMKLRDSSQLLPPQGSRPVTGRDLLEVNDLVRSVGLRAFRQEELEEFVHLGLFDAGSLVSIAGFHIYHDLYAEIGNIGTLHAQQGKGFGKRITSEICRVGLDKTSDLYLFVFEGNQAAIHIYESLGFETVQSYRFLQFAL